MSQFSCVIQEGGPAHRQTDELASALRELHARHYPGEDASVGWMPVPPGHMFTEGKQSTSSVIACRIDHVTTLDQRERYMRDVCDLWTGTTGCTDHEVVVSITDASQTTS